MRFRTLSNPALTPREKEIMELVICGYNNPQISEKLSISNHTTKAHLLKIYEKLDAKNRIEATLKYVISLENSEQKIDEIIENNFKKM